MSKVGLRLRKLMGSSLALALTLVGLTAFQPTANAASVLESAPLAKNHTAGLNTPTNTFDTLLSPATLATSPEDETRALPNTITGSWGVIGSFGNNTATSYISSSNWIGFCAFSPTDGPIFSNPNKPTTYTKLKTLTPSNFTITTPTVSGIQFKNQSWYYGAAALMNIYGVQYNYANSANAGMYEFTNKYPDASIRKAAYKLPKNAAETTRLVNNAFDNRGPYEMNVASHTISFNENGEQIITTTAGVKGGAGNYIMNGLGITFTVALTNATFADSTGGTSRAFNPGKTTLKYKVTDLAKPVSIVYTATGLPSYNIGLYTPNTGKHQPLLVGDWPNRFTLPKTVTVTPEGSPSASTVATYNKTNQTVTDVVTITGGKPNSSVKVESTLYYAGTTKPAESASIPDGAQKVGATNTQNITLNASGGATVNVPAVALGGKENGYYTWVTEISGEGNKTYVSPYGVSTETIFHEGYSPSLTTGAALSAQKPDGSYDATDTVVITKGAPNTDAIVKGQLYYHGTNVPVQTATVPSGATKVGSEVNITASLNASGSATVTLPAVNLPASSANGHYTWVTSVSGDNTTPYTSDYGVPSETFELEGSEVTVSTATSSPAAVGGSMVVNDTVTINGPPGLSNLSVVSKLYYHGTAKPSEVTSVPQGAKLVTTKTGTTSINSSGVGSFKTENAVLNSEATGFYTWVTEVSGPGIKNYVSNYGVPSETFSYQAPSPVLVTTASKGVASLTGATFADSVTITKGIPGSTVTVDGTVYFSTTKPVESQSIPGSAVKLRSDNKTVTLDANGAGTADLSVFEPRAEITEPGWITWVVKANGGGFTNYVSSYGVPAETVAWTGIQTGLTTQSSDAVFLDGGVSATDTMYITDEVPGTEGQVTFKLYYHGTSQPSQTEAVPSGATLVGESAAKPVTIGEDGSAVVTSDAVAVPLAQSGYYSWVASYDVSTEVPFSGEIIGVAGATPAGSGGAGVATTEGFYVVNSSGATTKIEGITGTVQGVAGDSGGYGVWSTDGFWIVAGDNSATKVESITGAIEGAYSYYGYKNYGGVVWTEDGFWIVNSDRSVIKAQNITGEVLSATGIYPTGTQGSGVITTDGYWLVKADGSSTKVPNIIEPFAGYIGGYGDYPGGSATQGSGVATLYGYYIVKPDGSTIKSDVPGLTHAVTTTQPLANLYGSGVVSTLGYHLVSPDGASQFVSSVTGDLDGAIGTRPLSDYGSGVWGTDGYWIVKRDATSIKVSGITGQVLGATGIYPAMSQGSGVWTTDGYWIVSMDGTSTKAQDITGVPIRAIGRYPSATASITGSAVWTSEGFWIVKPNGSTIKAVFPPSGTTTSKTLDYGVPSETFKWDGIQGPANITTEANTPVVDIANSTLSFTDQLFLSGGTPGTKVNVKADLYYHGTTQPTQSSTISGTLVDSTTQTVTLDANGAFTGSTDSLTKDVFSSAAGYYTWVLTTSSPDGYFAAKTSDYGVPGETVYWEGISTPAISTSSSEISWNGTTGSLTDQITLSGGTPGVSYAVTADLYRSETEPVQSATIPGSATKIGSKTVTKTIGADGTVSFSTDSVTLPTKFGGVQEGYYTWVVTAKGVQTPSQVVTSDYGVPSETVHWPGWKTPEVTTQASLTSAKTASLDTILLTSGTPGHEVGVSAQLYYTGTAKPSETSTVPGSAVAVGAPVVRTVTLDESGMGTVTTSAMTLPYDDLINQARVGHYTWVVTTSGVGIETQTSNYGIPSETVQIEGPSEGRVIISTQIESDGTNTNLGQEGEILLNSGDRVRDGIWAVGDNLSDYPTELTATLYGPITGTTVPETISTSTPKFFETTVTVDKPGQFYTGYSPAITDPGLYVWTYKFPGKTVTDMNGTSYTIYEGNEDRTFYAEEAARLLYSFETSTEASPAGVSSSGVEVSDTVTVSGYPANAEVTVTSTLWGPYPDKPVLSDEPLELVLGQQPSDPDDPNSPMVDITAAPIVGTRDTTVTTNSNGEATFTVNKFLDEDKDNEGALKETDIVLTQGGWYVWTDSSEGLEGITESWQSKFGIESEMISVVDAYTNVGESIAIQEGDKVDDTIFVNGPVSNPSVSFELYRQGNGGVNTDELVYSSGVVTSGFVDCVPQDGAPDPLGCKQVDSPEVEVGDDSTLNAGSAWEPGTYYWLATLEGQNGTLFQDDPRISTETFQYFMAESKATEYAVLGQTISDTLTLEGGLNPSLEVTFDLYKQGSGGIDTDTQVYPSELGTWVHDDTLNEDVWVPTTFPVWGTDIEDIPASATVEVSSPEVTVSEAGQYYWISKAVLGGEAGNQELYSDSARMSNESSVVVLNASVTTMTKPVAAIGEEIFDTALLSDAVPSGSTMVFELWQQNEGDVSNDTKLLTTNAISVEAAGEYDSPKVVINESGIFYWIERLIAPDGTTVIAEGSPRVSDETVYVPEIGTTLVDSNGDKEFVADSETTLVDTVSYENLRAGILYLMKGQLHLLDGTPLLINGDPVVATKEFTPTSTSGSIDVTFTLDTTDLKGKSLVAYEELFVKGETDAVATHQDPNDAGQTVSVIGEPPVVTLPFTGGTSALIFALIALLLAGLGTVVVIRYWRGNEPKSVPQHRQ